MRITKNEEIIKRLKESILSKDLTTNNLIVDIKSFEKLIKELSQSWTSFYNLAKVIDNIEEFKKKHKHYFTSYYELRKLSFFLEPLMRIERNYDLLFDKQLISHDLYYDQNRYFVFAIDFMDYLHKKTSFASYISHHYSCNKRNEIGELLVRLPLKLIMVYYKTSRRVNFYLNSKSEIIKLSNSEVKGLSVYSLKEYLKQTRGK